MTGGEGGRIHAFCRRIYPKSSAGDGLRYPIVLCVMFEELWPTMLFKVGFLVLLDLELYHFQVLYHARCFPANFHNKL